MAQFDDVTDLDAESLSHAIHARALSCREVMQAYLARIQALNPVFNAIVNLADEEALLQQADARDAELARGESRGWMHGMPQAIKDTGQALGFPTTLGSSLLRSSFPREDSLYVARMKAAGCIVIGKTNMPELGLGSHTYNALFGPTLNAWDTAVSAGGSSGGAAVALAQRLLPVADGSDFMGSLRNPAGWNHVFGLRPSQGRVPGWPRPELYVSQLVTEGPMGRTVLDVARLLSIQAGHDPRVPLSLADRLPQPHWPDKPSLRGQRIGWLADLGGHLPLAPGILTVCEQALRSMEDAGAVVEPVSLDVDLERIWQAWLVWRRALVAPSVAPLLALPNARATIKPEALWEHDTAQGMGVAEFMAASRMRGDLHQKLLALLQRHDALALPVAQVWPFDVAMNWPRTVAGRTMETYHRWMEVTLYATFAGLPAMSVPAGFDVDGRWPMGLQLIGQPLGEAPLLALAAGYEATVPDLLRRRPPPPSAHVR